MDEAQWMSEALALAADAGAAGEIPVGAVVVDRDGVIIGRGRNRRESGDPLGHAELIAIAEAAKTIGDWRLEGTTMVVTLEPCAMCAGALVNARVAKLIFGASDPKPASAARSEIWSRMFGSIIGWKWSAGLPPRSREDFCRSSFKGYASGRSRRGGRVVER